MNEKRIWTFVYEPTNLNEMVLNPEIRPKLEKAIKEVPNLLLYGSAGIGKGTFTKIFIKKTGLDHMWINASDKTGIDFIRNDVKPFAYAASKHIKIVVFNEAEALSGYAGGGSSKSGAQKILKQLIEDTEKVCRYVFLTNHIQFILPEIRSRCQEHALDNLPIKEIILFGSRILKSENISFENKLLIKIAQKCYPDIRKTIQALQENSIDGKLVDSKIYTAEEIFEQLLELMLVKDLEKIRTLLRSNYIDYVSLYEFLFENVDKFASPGGAILEIADHIKLDNDVPNKEINFIHMVVHMMLQKVIK
jgi:DNA polymerase III delta prime subunit